MSTSPSSRRDQLRNQQDAAARQKRINRIIVISAAAVALTLIAVFVVVIVQQVTGTASQSAQITPAAANADQTALVANTSPADDGAPVVTIYLDYQCPNCRALEETYGSLLESEANAGTWTLQYKTMTFMDQNLQNTASTRAALAASCAANEGYYAVYHDTIYANQAEQEVVGSEGYSDELLRVTIPNTIGMSEDEITTFQQCYDNQQTSQFVSSVAEGAYTDGVTGTPTIAVNGKLVDLSTLTDSSEEGFKNFLLAQA